MTKKGLKTFIVGGGVAISLLIPLVAGVIVYQNNKALDYYQEIASTKIVLTKSLGEILFKFRQIRIAVRSVPFIGNTP